MVLVGKSPRKLLRCNGEANQTFQCFGNTAKIRMKMKLWQLVFEQFEIQNLPSYR